MFRKNRKFKSKTLEKQAYCLAHNIQTSHVYEEMPNNVEKDKTTIIIYQSSKCTACSHKKDYFLIDRSFPKTKEGLQDKETFIQAIRKKGFREKGEFQTENMYDATFLAEN